MTPSPFVCYHLPPVAVTPMQANHVSGSINNNGRDHDAIKANQLAAYAPILSGFRF